MATIKVKKDGAWIMASQSTPGNDEDIRGVVANNLYGKTAVFLGDSFCLGQSVDAGSAEYGYGWGGLIGEANSMTWLNYAVNGATVSNQFEDNHYILNQAVTAYANYPNADYIIFNGGVNDAEKLGASGLGTLASTGYSPTSTADFTSAFESLLLYLITNFPNAKIGYIVTHKAWTSTYNQSNPDDYSDNHPYRTFFNRAIEICEKWGIPYVDIWCTDPMNPSLSVYDDYYSEESGCGKHLSSKGYHHVVGQIERFMREM